MVSVSPSTLTLLKLMLTGSPDKPVDTDVCVGSPPLIADARLSSNETVWAV